MTDWTDLPAEEMIQVEDVAELVRTVLKLSPRARASADRHRASRGRRLRGSGSSQTPGLEARRAGLARPRFDDRAHRFLELAHGHRALEPLEDLPVAPDDEGPRLRLEAPLAHPTVEPFRRIVVLVDLDVDEPDRLPRNGSPSPRRRPPRAHRSGSCRTSASRTSRRTEASPAATRRSNSEGGSCPAASSSSASTDRPPPMRVSASRMRAPDLPGSAYCRSSTPRRSRAPARASRFPARREASTYRARGAGDSRRRCASHPPRRLRARRCVRAVPSIRGTAGRRARETPRPARWAIARRVPGCRPPGTRRERHRARGLCGDHRDVVARRAPELLERLAVAGNSRLRVIAGPTTPERKQTRRREQCDRRAHTRSV